MKNIALSADESLIEQAREAVRRRQTTLSQLFREWLDAGARVLVSEDLQHGREIGDLRIENPFATSP